MKFKPVDPPREYKCGIKKNVSIKDCARIELDTNEQVTFLMDTDTEYDITRKSWGFYATPSLNGRLKQFGLKSALIKNSIGRYFIFLVKEGKEGDLQKYLKEEDNEIVCWLDSEKQLEQIEKLFKEANKNA